MVRIRGQGRNQGRGRGRGDRYRGRIRNAHSSFKGECGNASQTRVEHSKSGQFKDSMAALRLLASTEF